MTTLMTKTVAQVHQLNVEDGKKIKQLFRSKTDGKTHLDEICVAIIDTIRIFPNTTGRLGFVTGIIASEGHHLIDRNMEILEAYANHLRGKSEFPIFCATDIFYREFLHAVKWNTTFDFFPMWRKVISEGGVTDLFQTPRWRLSLGARDEHEHSSTLQIRIHDLDEDTELRTILDLHRKPHQY
jgi:hypothetical protein